MEHNKPIYILGGVGVVVVILLLLKKSGSSGPTVITSPAATGSSTDPNQARIAELGINADLFKNLAGLVYQQKAADTAGQVGLAQVEASRQVGLAQTATAGQVAAAQIAGQSQITAAQLASQSQLAGIQAQLQQAAINAARDVGLAQSQADILRSQMQYDAQASQQAAQNRANILQGLFGQLGNVLKAIGAQQQPKAAAGAGSAGGASSGGGSGASTATTRPRVTQPAIPKAPAIDFTGALNKLGINVGEPQMPFMVPDYGTPNFTIPDWGAYAYTDPVPTDFGSLGEFFNPGSLLTPYTGEPIVTDEGFTTTPGMQMDLADIEALAQQMSPDDYTMWENTGWEP